MLVLAMDTSSSLLSVALGDDDRIIGEKNIVLPRGTMSEILPTIDELLAEAGFSIGDVEAIVVGVGPGSYTGLRIGVVVARTLAQTLEIPIIALPSIDAIAYRNSRRDVFACPIVDAKRHEVYTALYCMDVQGLKRLEEFKVIAPIDLANALRVEEFGKVLLAGDAVGLYGDEMVEVLADSVELAPEEMWLPHAADLISVAFTRIQNRQFDDLHRVAPIYVRLSQAEEMWEKRNRGESK